VVDIKNVLALTKTLTQPTVGGRHGIKEIGYNLVDPETDARWNDYVQRHPAGLIYHHSAWGQVLASTFGYQPHYIAAQNGTAGQFEGVLPLMLTRSRLTGQRLISLPFTSHCTPLVAEARLEKLVDFIANRCPVVGYMELRFLGAATGAPAQLESRCGYVTHTLDLSPGPQQLFRKFHLTSIRQMIKRAEKKGLKFRLAESEDELKEFFRLHIEVRKRHGLPPHPYAFFANMWRILKPKGMLLVPVVEHEGRIIASALILRFRDNFIYEYSASDHTKLNLGPNQLLIWEIIKIACREGAGILDLGRSARNHHSLIRFKSRWGAVGKGLTYCFYPKAGRLDTQDGIARKMLGAINRLLPDAALKLEGELIYGHLG
jgi:CelD/BcsL family acetyltransferase involved in cellulose biosynthesis